MRLIDADSLKNKIQQHCDLFVDAWGGLKEMSLADKSRVDEIDNCIAEIVNAPTIDATPVVHGRWIGPTRVDVNNNKYECSECGFWGVPGWAACPKCTAKMDGGVSDG